MKRHIQHMVWLRGWVGVLCFEMVFGAGALGETADAAILEALARVTGRAPETYPAAVTQVPDRDFQEALIPDLLAFLDFQPDRDTMYGQSGQAEALRLLTRLRVEELIPRLPVLMDKPMRGDGLFADCIAAIKAFGADAEEILPQLRERMARKENELAELGDRDDRHARWLRDRYEPRLEALKEAIRHVVE